MTTKTTWRLYEIRTQETPPRNCETSEWPIYVGVVMSMRFIREIPENRIVDRTINDLEQSGLTLVWKRDSVEVWAECMDTAVWIDERQKAA